jgi:hypothetical protein
MTNKIIREKEHYARVDRQKDYRVAQNKFYGGIVSTKVEECFGLMIGDVGGRNILPIGCGKGGECICGKNSYCQ